METAPRINRRQSDPDIAIRLLRQSRTPMHYRDLLTETLKQKGESTEITPVMMAQMLTQINLDCRFVHMGKGIWGLRDWNPSTKTTAAEKPRTVRAKIPDDLIEDLEEELIDEEVVDELDEDEVDVSLDEETEDFDDIEEIEGLDEDDDEEEQP
jgi:DNA-directed RNA polymerase subunit delta